MTAQYIHFARVYDKWMQNVDYTEWWHYLATTFSLSKGMRVLELGCGTGSLTEQMLRAGLDVTATDTSSAMLTQAEQKVRSYPHSRLLCLDMRRLPQDLGLYDVAIAACDVVNYLRGTDELANFLRGLRPLLKTDGVLLFDVHGPGRMTEWRNGPYYNRVGENSCYMLHVTLKDTRIAQRLTGFVRGTADTWTRFDELHRQTYFCQELLDSALIDNGFAKTQFYEFGAQNKPSESSLRLQVAAR